MSYCLHRSRNYR
uniref:Cleavage stimulation factor subunit 1 n=1 Tax=Triatoma infestans TaxID=30076 RepID=A0A170WWH2_TRIIF